MRTSLSQQIQTALIYTNSASQKLITAQEHAVSGKRINAPSDDVPGTNKSLSLRSAINTTQQFTNNTTVNLPLLKATDSALQSLTAAIQSVRSLALKAATPDMSGLSTETYTQQLDDIMVQIADIANTKHTDQFIFSGTATNIPAVSTTGVAATPYQYDGNQGTRSTQVLSWVSLQVNIPGSKVFNFDGSAGAGSTDVFAMISQLKTAIESGDTTAVSSQLDNIDANLDNVLSVEATIGSWESRMESAANTLGDTKVRLQEMLSDTEDIDLTEAIVDLKTQENVYQTALSITSQILKMSIASMN